jgi:hypothetical protein
MRTIFKIDGSLTEWGIQALNDFTASIQNLLERDEVASMTESELHLLGSVLAQKVGQAICNKTARKKQMSNIFDKMSDQEFQDYLREKNGDLYLMMTFTPEEMIRMTAILNKATDDLLEVWKKR